MRREIHCEFCGIARRAVPHGLPTRWRRHQSGAAVCSHRCHVMLTERQQDAGEARLIPAITGAHGADAGEANSMTAIVPGPVACGQPEGPSKKERHADA